MSKLLESYRNERGLALRSVNEPVDYRGANNMFGSIANGRFPFSTNMDFIPADANSNIIDIAGKNVDPQWLGLSTPLMQYWAYNYCSPLAAVIDRLAEADTNGELQIVNADYTVRENYRKDPKANRVMNLLMRPNPIQTWEEFNSEQVVICKIYGYCPVFAVIPAGMDRSHAVALWNLNPYYARPTFNDRFSYYGNTALTFEEIKAGIDAESIIKYWSISVHGRTYGQIPASDVMLLKDGFVDSSLQNMGLPISKIAGLDYFVSNICAAMEADNVLLKKKGPLGVFSHDPKPDMAGWQPLNPKDKEVLQNELKRYGMTIGQLQYIVSSTPIKWNSMSFNVQELMTKETVRQGIDGICDRLGYPAELMSGKNATYENRSSAEKYLYQNNVIPFSFRRMTCYNWFFGIEGLYLNYDHLPVLQEDIVKAATAKNALSQSLTLDWENGMITWNEYRKAIKLQPVSGFDIYYPEYQKKFPPAVQMPAKSPVKKVDNAA